MDGSRHNNAGSSVRFDASVRGGGSDLFLDEKKESNERQPLPQGGRMSRPSSRRLHKSMSKVFLPRLITRDYPFDQSSNQVQVSNTNRKGTWSLFLKDWFHCLLRIPWYVTIPAFLLLWYFMIWVFAWVYVHLDGNSYNLDIDCGLGDPGVPINLSTAYAFSLETCTTVGYGLPGSANGFFKSDCKGLQNFITLQMIWSMMSNAFLVSFFFALISKPETRSIQIIFSKNLCVNVVDGKVCINVRCYDLDSANPLVECHARMYLIDGTMKFHPLRLLAPDDGQGGNLYPSVPTSIIHHIDHHSALSPRNMPLIISNQGLPLRSVDSATGSRDEIVCPVCGEAYGSYDRLMKHINYARIVEAQDGYPIEGTHLGFEMPDTTPITLSDVQKHIERKLSEIVVVVEAIDPQLSGTFQAVQSYKYDEIEFGADFEKCLSTRNNKFVVDLLKFHGIEYDDDMYDQNSRRYLSTGDFMEQDDLDEGDLDEKMNVNRQEAV